MMVVIPELTPFLDVTEGLSAPRPPVSELTTILLPQKEHVLSCQMRLRSNENGLDQPNI